jgi:polyhydroxybutyrate depolymerase
VKPLPSAGCGGKTQKRGEQRLTLESGGDERSYYRFIPRGYNGDRPFPVVLELHGTSEGAAVQKASSALGPFGDKHGFITLTPEGSGPPPQWDTHPHSADIKFLVDLLDETEQGLCIDARRVFVTGFSNGAMVTSVMACEFSDRIAAVAPVSGIRNPATCDQARPVPVVAFHGVADEWLAYRGGYGPGVYGLGGAETQELIDIASPTESGLSIPEVTFAWAMRNGCEAPPEQESVAPDVTLFRYTCPNHADVQLYAIDGAGHTWPGSKLMAGLESYIGPTTFSIDADAIMWKFFQQHPLRGTT